MLIWNGERDRRIGEYAGGEGSRARVNGGKRGDGGGEKWWE